MPNLVRNSRATEQGVSGWGLAWVPNTEKDHFGSRIQDLRPILPSASLISRPRGVLLPGGGILILHFLLLSFWNKAFVTCCPGLPVVPLKVQTTQAAVLLKSMCLLGSVKRNNYPDLLMLIWFTWPASVTHVLGTSLIRKECSKQVILKSSHAIYPESQ